MGKKGAIELSTGFIVTLIICIVVFGFSVFIVKKFFTHAENIKMTYDERTEREIERLLDDGSKIAIPFDKKTIGNGEFQTFGIGVLNTLNTGPSNEFEITVSFKKAISKDNVQICPVDAPAVSPCGDPDLWLQTTAGQGTVDGVEIQKTIRNNEQEKFLLGVAPKNAPAGIYIFNLVVCYNDGVGTTSSPDCASLSGYPDIYDTLHKIYVEVS